MILIGLNEQQKQREICRYVEEHGIRNVIVFSDEHFFMALPELPKIRQIGYKETIMYRTFYPLLEEIDDSCLLVMNEMMRDRNRSCLTYNCVAKFTNQTPHRMVFEYLPVVEERKDVLILLDFATSQRDKGRSLADVDLSGEDIRCVRRRFRLRPIHVPVLGDGEARYEAEKERLFAGLGTGDPNIIPRRLHLWTGRFKKPEILFHPELTYAALNQRFKMPNVVSYPDAEPGREYVLVDLPLERKKMNDFLRRTGQEELPYLSTDFPLDHTYIKAFEDWMEEVTWVYDQTGVYAEAGD